jgi:hypothetical protein
MVELADIATHLFYTTPPPDCAPMLEQGFGVGIGGTADDSAVYFDVQRGKQPDEAAFRLPSFCPK